MRPSTMMVVGAVVAVAAAGLVYSPAVEQGSTNNAADGAAAAVQAAGTAGAAPALGVGERLLGEYLAQPLAGITAASPERPVLQVLIATVPDPVESGLDWIFDAMTAALRSGMESCKFVLDRQSLPWYDSAGRLASVSSASPPWRTRPGAMLFRPAEPLSKELVLVYLVGESPTSGVAREAFLTALAERERLLSSKHVVQQEDPPVVRIIGPTFSGSSRSIRLALEAAPSAPIEKGRVLILSGSATSLGNVQELTGHPPRGEDCRWTDQLPPPGVTFCATVHPDPDLKHALESAVEALFPRRKRIKVVNFYEVTTSYGQQVGKADAVGPGRRGGGVTEIPFPFPIAISVLRAGEKTPAAADQQAAPGLWGTRKARTELPLTDVHPSGDLPLPASALAPGYLEVVLNSMVRAVRQERPQLAGILATDVRDKIFLASVLHDEMPDLQLYTFESNLLFMWPGFANSLRGMLVFTSYPLSPEAQKLTALPNDRGALHFLLEGGEGVFNATRLHLGRFPLLDYRVPLSDQKDKGGLESPPVWVTAVGRDHLVPLRVVTASEPATRGYLERVQASATSTRVRRQLGDGTLAMLLILGCLALALAIRSMRDGGFDPLNASSGWSLRRAFGKGAASRVGGSSQSPRAVSLLLQEELCTAAVLATLAAMVLPLPVLCLGVLGPETGMHFPWRHLSWDLAIYFVMLVAAALMAVAALVAAAAAIARAAATGTGNLAAFRGIFRGKSTPDDPLPRFQWWLETVVEILVVVLSVSFFVLYLRMAASVLQLGEAQGAVFELFLQRLLALDSGLSPLLPLMLVGLVIVATFTWGLWHVRALRDQVAFEVCGRGFEDKGIQTLFRRAAELNDRLYFMVPDKGAAVLAFVVLICAGLWWTGFDPTLESVAFGEIMGGRPLDALLRLSVLFGVAAIAWFGYRFYSVWSALRSALSTLRGRPVAGAFSKVETEMRWPLLPWKARKRFLSGALDPLSARGLAMLRSDVAVGATSPGGDLVHRLQEANLEDERALPLGSRPGSMQARLAHVLVGVLQVLADRGAFLRTGGAKPAPKADGKTERPAPTGAEAFFASQFTLYCQKVMRQLWMIGGAAFALWIVMTLLVSSYPHLAPAQVHTALVLELGVLVPVFLVVIFRMSRDPILSAIEGTAESKFFLDTGTTLKLIMFVVTPFLTLLGSETSAVRTFLGSSLFDLLKLLK
ncbi:MAG: hypothetical protein LJE95_16270 [Acidobacteria bacterium]|nr:hypothetical protein [Acidobacteriota bacterium]